MPFQNCSIPAPALTEGPCQPLPCRGSPNRPEGHLLTREGWQCGMAGVTEGLWGCKGSSCRDGSILGDPHLGVMLTAAPRASSGWDATGVSPRSLQPSRGHWGDLVTSPQYPPSR